MTATYDYLIIGGGITGSALGYELARKGQKVLLLEREPAPGNATMYSYGGLAYWSGTTEITRKLYREGIDIHRNLCNELEADTEFREIDLVLTIGAGEDPVAVAKSFEGFDIRPELLDVREAIELEPLLDPDAISGVLRLPHGHINAGKTNRAYQDAFRRHGGAIAIEPAIELILDDRIVRGVRTPVSEYRARTTIVCAGGLTRSFLQKAGISVRCYFTRAAMIALEPTDLELRTLVMPATGRRIFLERQVSEGEREGIWDETTAEAIDSVLEPGAIQFGDRSLYIGQVSAIVTDPFARLDAESTEANIRNLVGQFLPALRDLPGTYRECLVAFAPFNRPVIGPIDGFEGIQVFSGFTSTLVAAPPLAKHFARYLVGEPEEMIGEFTDN
ncbi:FAD-binding oxidoreductase [Pannus brasiliensis CCIBt3594]|uniref:FAD-binding oxidoreductase n=1 Tax=Pannus brasiliensis CCIBt3594 TaxID=1427578 RepID=A0AAW9QS12_9CHRO